MVDPAVLAHTAAVYAKRKADMAQMVHHAETQAKRLVATDLAFESENTEAASGLPVGTLNIRLKKRHHERSVANSPRFHREQPLVPFGEPVEGP